MVQYLRTSQRTKIKGILFALVVTSSCQNKANTETAQQANTIKEKIKPIFEKITTQESGIVFTNQITEDLSSLENLFNYDYFYNGAGVGLEDINNDGLLDVFFCGNQVPNKLFLNKGDFQFEDISQEAMVNSGKTWGNGVSFVDINNDGWMDIYVSQGGPNPRTLRRNLLFINQMDNTFKEEAKKYGLDDMGISTQSVFFDYDNDGDLDCLVMNENEYYGVDPVTLQRLLVNNDEANYFNSSHLYQNNNGFFTDITKKAGIEQPIFGLGLAVTDINNDNLLDIYIASDYYIPDALFINQGDGTFKDEIKQFTQQISYYGMGIDIEDINNDGLQDIFVLDMASSDHVRSKTLMASMSTDRFDYLVNEANYQYQYMFNSLQLNVGNNKFSNVAQLTKMANTDWSWSVLMTDFDLDEDRDIYVTNGYRKYALDNDLQNKVFREKIKYKGNVPLEIKKSLYDQMPSEKLPNILFENLGKLQFKNNAKKWGLDDLTFSNGAAQGDLDNDGDLDLIVNNIDENALVYKNTSRENALGNYFQITFSKDLADKFPKTTIYYDGKTQFYESKRIKGYRSSHTTDAFFGMGGYNKIDSLTISWPNGKMVKKNDIDTNQSIEITLADLSSQIESKKIEKPVFTLSNSQIGYLHQENPFNDFKDEILLPYRQSTQGPFISNADVNNDGLTDIYIGNSSGFAAELYLQNKNGFSKKNIPVFEQDKGYEDLSSIFIDYDLDGDQDLYVVSGGYEFAKLSSYYSDRIYINDGQGNFTRGDNIILDQQPKNGKSIIKLDFDNDGDDDLLIGNHYSPHQYPRFEHSVLYENKNGKFVDVTETQAKDLLKFGIINQAIATDYNNDGQVDFVAVGEWTGIGFFKNQNGVFSLDDSKKAFLDLKGWWYSIEQGDLNNDGTPDFLVGNVGLNLKFKTSPKKPFKVYANDFDGNGSNDIVLTKLYNGDYVPVRGRECSSQQMPFIKEKFETYNDFANASLIDIYGDKLEESYFAETNTFESIALLSDGKNYKVVTLPVEAQMFPVLSIARLNPNATEAQTFLLGGNIYETEVETPRLDAYSGMAISFDNTENRFHVVSNQKTGLYIQENVKQFITLNNDTKPILLVGINNGPLKIYDVVNDN